MERSKIHFTAKCFWEKFQVILFTILLYLALIGSNYLFMYFDKIRVASYKNIPSVYYTIALQGLLVIITAVFLRYVMHRPPCSRRFRIAEFLIFFIPGIILSTPELQFFLLPSYFPWIGLWDPYICFHDAQFVYLGGIILVSGIIRFIKIKPAG